MYSVVIITLSDSRDNIKKIDKSGLYLKDIFKENGYTIKKYILLKDDIISLKENLTLFVNDKDVDLIITTGGTGLSPRDITPETTKEVIDKEIPGIMEYLRHQSMVFTKRAVLSRGVAGICNKTLIINLPGSPKAVKEYTDELWDIIPHALNTICGRTQECGRS